MPAPTLVFPDVAELALTVVNDALTATGDTVPTGTTVPDPRPDAFVIVQRIGGVMRPPVLEDAQLAVECWGPDLAAATDLAGSVRQALHDAQGTTVAGAPVYRVTDVQGPTDVPDELSDQPRFQFTVALTVRGRKP